jgi:hypothetical protein
MTIRGGGPPLCSTRMRPPVRGERGGLARVVAQAEPQAVPVGDGPGADVVGDAVPAPVAGRPGSPDVDVTAVGVALVHEHREGAVVRDEGLAGPSGGCVVLLPGSGPLVQQTQPSVLPSVGGHEPRTSERAHRVGQSVVGRTERRGRSPSIPGRRWGSAGTVARPVMAAPPPGECHAW